ncbi:MAG: DUF4173 domain-containing protein [Cytophagaceae bacterium]|nr:DUF4173 domain-containing protein [Cytophagaceae bacterium]
MNKITLSFSMGLISWYLFYQEQPGLNVLIAQVLAMLIVLLTLRKSFEKTSWALFGMASLSALSVFYWGQFGTSVLLFSTWLLLMVQLHYPQASLLFSSLHSIHSLLSVPLSWMHYKSQTTSKFSGTTITTVLLSLALLVLALLYYRSSNPLFALVISNIPFPEISLPALLFILVSTWVAWALSNPRTLGLLTELDAQWRRSSTTAVIAPALVLASIIVLAGLNLMLLALNSTDTYFLFFSSIPAEVSYSDFLHQSVNSSIVSILLAVVLIVTLSILGISQTPSYRRIQLLLYGWIAQHVWMALLSLQKNSLYVIEYGLTYKRLGVYAYILVCLMGLLFTAWMCFKNKNVWYLLRSNAWNVLIVLFVFFSISWDTYIAQFNLQNARTTDRNYVLSLGNAALPALVEDAMAHPQAYTQVQQNYLEDWTRLVMKRERSWHEFTWNQASILQACQAYQQFREKETATRTSTEVISVQ